MNCAAGPRDVRHRLLPRRQRQGQRRPPRDRRPRHQLLQRRGQVQPQGLLPLVRDRQDQRHQDRVHCEFIEHVTGLRYSNKMVTVMVNVSCHFYPRKNYLYDELLYSRINFIIGDFLTGFF